MTKLSKAIYIRMSDHDLDRMTETRIRLGIQQSEFIRRAIKMYDAEQRIEIFKQTECISPPTTDTQPPKR
jgi:hypothetical protein